MSGLIVTAAVEVAGVLLIFSYYAVTAACAMLITASLGKRPALGRLFGVAAGVVGLFVSATLDFPTGAAIVCTFGILFSATIVTAVTVKRR